MLTPRVPLSLSLSLIGRGANILPITRALLHHPLFHPASTVGSEQCITKKTFLESLIGHSFVSAATSPTPRWQWAFPWQRNGKQSHLLWGRTVDLHERACVGLRRRKKHRPSCAQEERMLILNWEAAFGILNATHADGNLITGQLTVFSYGQRKRERAHTGGRGRRKKAQDLEFTLILTQNLACREAPCCLGIF